MAEFSRDRVFAFSQEDPDGEVTKIEDFLPNASLNAAGMPPWDNVIDFEFGPDGSLYVLDYGDGFFRPNPDAGLYRVDYVEGTKGPRVQLDASVTSGQGPLDGRLLGRRAAPTRTTSRSASRGTSRAPAPSPMVRAEISHTYTEDGQYTARVRVTDSSGRVSLASVVITVGNTAPTIEIVTPETVRSPTGATRSPSR